jgi:hypothetical protein
MTASAPPPTNNPGAPTAGNTSATGQLPAWLLSSAGASALLVAFGYLVEVARDELLGVALRDNITLAEYGVSGARFLVNVLTLAFRIIALHPVVAFSVVVVMTAVALAAGRLIWLKEARSPRPGAVVLQLVLILILLLAKAAALDIPAAIIDNVLIERTDPYRAFDASPAVNFITQKYWQTVICAHATRAAEAGLKCQPGAAKRTLENLFLLNCVITVFAATWTLTLAAMTFAEATAKWQSTISAARALAWFAVLVSVIALPYNYGKTVASTSFKQVNIYFRTSGNGSAQSRETTVAANSDPSSVTDATQGADLTTVGTAGETSAPTSPPLNERDELTGPALLLTGNANVVTLYYLGDDLIREVSRTDIEHIKIRPALDVLQLHMDRELTQARKQ